MHRVLLASVVAGALVAPLAHAQGYGGPGSGPGGPERHEMAPEHRPDGPPPRVEETHRDWRRGDRLPREYWDRQYVIDDWRAYRLTPPPRGYHWVGVGGDYLLVQISTGVVLRIGP
jgi:Ni/Co efflux regulator RcnB